MHGEADNLIVSFMPKCFKQCFVFSCPALTCPLPSKARVHIIRKCQRHTTRTIGEDRFTTPALHIYKIPLEVAAHCTYIHSAGCITLTCQCLPDIHIHTYHAATASSETSLIIHMLVITAGGRALYIRTYILPISYTCYVHIIISDIYIHTVLITRHCTYTQIHRHLKCIVAVVELWVSWY